MATLTQKKYPYIEGIDYSVKPFHYDLNMESYVIGRNPATCNIVVGQEIVSRIHAKIQKRGQRYLLLDNNSRNGTYVNGVRISNPHLLTTGDMIGLGSEMALFRFVDNRSHELAHTTNAMDYVLS